MKPITAMPDTMTYDEATQRLTIGDGVFEPVPPQVWGYTVGGRNILASWFNYRKRTPGGRKSSPLDDIHVDEWPDAWSIELLEVLSAMRRCTELEPA